MTIAATQWVAGGVRHSHTLRAVGSRLSSCGASIEHPNIFENALDQQIERQQTFIAALVNKVRSAGTLTRLDRVVRFLDAATSSLEVDPGLGSTTRLAKIAMQLQSIGLDKVQFVTVPNAYYPRESEFWGRVYWTEDGEEHVRGYYVQGVMNGRWRRRLERGRSSYEHWNMGHLERRLCVMR